MSVRAESSKPSGVAEIAISGGGGGSQPDKKNFKIIVKTQDLSVV